MTKGICQKSERQQNGTFSLRPHVDWIALGLAFLLALLLRYVPVHIPW